MKRRAFLRYARDLGGGLVGSSLLGTGFPGTAAPAEAGGGIRVGVVTEPDGFHLDLFLRPLASAAGVSQVALADWSGQSFAIGRKRLGSRFADLRTFRDFRAMFREFNPHLVVVTVVPVNAPAILEAALDIPAHILTDKPPCVRLAEFERIAAKARVRHREVMIAYPTRLSAPARKARELVESGLIGKVYAANLQWIADQTRLRSPAWQKRWPSLKDQSGGGKLMFHGTHYIDLLQYLIGDRVTAVCGFCGNVGGQPIETEDAAVIAMQFRQGAMATLNTGYYLDRGYDNKVTVWGSEGWFRFGFEAASVPLEWTSTRSGAPEGVQTFAPPPQPDDYHLLTVGAVNAARGLEPPPLTTEEGLSVLKVAFAGYRAAETGVTQRAD